MALSAAAELDAMEGRWPSTNNVAVRFGVVVSLFFEGGATTEKRRAALAVVRDYCERFHDKVTHYQKLGASRLTRIKSLDFLDGYATGIARTPSDEGVDLAVYGFENGVESDDPVLWYVGGTAMGPFELAPADTSSLDMYLPASWLADAGPEGMIALVTLWANMLKPAHGTAGFGTLFNPGGGRQSAALLKRFPGLDYNDSIAWSSARGDDTRHLIRTTSWLNILCSAYVADLGGRAAMSATLPATCQIVDLDDGLLVVAGPQPQLFDQTHGLPMGDYKAVAAVFRPLRFEGFQRYSALFAAVPEPLDPVAESLRWVRRFD
ncbi:hypothetical protein RHAL1_03406 [Beijerinckiaceae bacterium RH AL1]|nr:DUF3396 domain-containing protein [Beijerinckiaceae bacterium]VVB48607.1 hypothetical protein RHCH11_RHCH11_03340 [Beijerinckiaceae bacterium RH CH11]VVB48688.1 hypothetical protein RHAL8_03336 [Beijerinckiaceae bacterium RH AL8]VVC56479.1 hypothetical protein RHAL1_03406 [Beijerinckiaceae bacterium RH AL1]